MTTLTEGARPLALGRVELDSKTYGIRITYERGHPNKQEHLAKFLIGTLATGQYLVVKPSGASAFIHCSHGLNLGTAALAKLSRFFHTFFTTSKAYDAFEVINWVRETLGVLKNIQLMAEGKHDDALPFFIRGANTPEMEELLTIIFYWDEEIDYGC